MNETCDPEKCAKWCGKSSCMEQGCENRLNYTPVANPEVLTNRMETEH